MTDDRFYPGMKGGTKHAWLTKNRQVILAVAEQLGDAEACRIFQLRPSKLEELASAEIESNFHWGKADKALLTAKMVETGVLELKDKFVQLEDMERFFSEIVTPVLSMIAGYVNKQRDADIPRRELLKVTPENLQLTHETHKLYVMSALFVSDKQNYTPLLICRRTGLPCPLVFLSLDGTETRQRLNAGKKRASALLNKDSLNEKSRRK